MDRRIIITRHDYGMTIADDRTGLRLEVYELVNGLSIEAYGYHSRSPQPVMVVGDTDGFREVTPIEGRPHPEVQFRMTDPKPVTRTRAR